MTRPIVFALATLFLAAFVGYLQDCNVRRTCVDEIEKRIDGGFQ